jgi:hypothetical protein
MQELNFQAQLTRLGEPTMTDSGATVEFDVGLSWRSARGAQSERNMPFRAQIVPDGDGWRLAGVARIAG